MASNTSILRVVAAAVWLRNARLRMPFRFGRARMTAAPVAHLRVEVEDAAGRRGWGVSADLLPPAWFDKRPGRTQRQDMEDLLLSIELARAAWLDHPPATPFDLWRGLERPLLQGGAARGLPPLAAGFGGSLFERAILDAAARLAGAPAWQLIAANALGVDLAALHPDLREVTLPQVLPARPVETVWARHTVGLADPLTAADLPPGQALNDGLPQTLEEVVRFYAPAHYKLKIGGDPAADLDRLERIAAVLERAAPTYVTLDGNEQYATWEAVEALVAGLTTNPKLAQLAAAVQYVEQPLYRDQALRKEGAAARAAVAAWRPLLIDESDDTPEAWPAAARLGYRGVSFKACKGFYRGLRNIALAQAWSRAGQGRFVVSSEDLTALPLVPLQQNLALGAMLGIASQERNGHHYTRGLTWLPPAEQERALAQYPGLYTAEGGLPRLNIRSGRLEVASLFAWAGLAVAQEPPWETMTPAEAWRHESLDAEPSSAP